MFLDEAALEQFLADAILHYEGSAPAISKALEDLYERLNERPEQVTLAELRQLSRLRENGEWEHPEFAENRWYKLLSSLPLLPMFPCNR